MRISMKRTCCFFMICMMFLGSAHFALADQYLAQEKYFAHQESPSGLFQVPGVDEPVRYYAQNDDLWASCTYERKKSTKWRPFRDSGCSPTSLAMAVARLVPEEELMKINDYAKRPYSLCNCSINSAACERHLSRYVLTSEQDFVRFLPLVLGDFATGNNQWDVCSRSDNAGTGTGYIDKVCKVYGLEYEFVSKYDAALEALKKEDHAVFALSGSGGMFTNVGHYIYLAHADEEKLYVLDPLCRTSYEHCKYGRKLEIIQPGLVAMKHTDAVHAHFSNFIILKKP